MDRYETIDGLEFYRFEETYIAQIEQMNGYFFMVLDNVTILPNNPHNRDIREMRANEFTVTIREGKITSFVREGYKVYDPNGSLMQQYEDEPVEASQYATLLQELEGAQVLLMEKKDDKWLLVIEGEEDSYDLVLTGTQDVEKWNRFLNK